MKEEFPKLMIIDDIGTGMSHTEMQMLIATLKATREPPIIVDVQAYKKSKLEDLDVIENALNTDVYDYINRYLTLPTHKILKSGGDDRFYVVDNPDAFNQDNQRVKIRKNSNYTKPKRRHRK